MSKGTPSDFPTKADAMVAYLKRVLEELETAQGGVDEEASAALKALEQQTAQLQRFERRASAETSGISNSADEIQLAQEIDRLDARLSEVEQQVEKADDCTKELLKNSTELWLSGSGSDTPLLSNAGSKGTETEPEVLTQPDPPQDGGKR